MLSFSGNLVKVNEKGGIDNLPLVKPISHLLLSARELTFLKALCRSFLKPKPYVMG